MIAKCRCQHCNEYLEFDSKDLGRLADCPKCHMETPLFSPPTTKPAVRVAQSEPPAQRSVESSTIFGAYFLAVVIPFAGFFAGIYLMTKKESGHGITAIAISIGVFLLILALMFS